MREIDDLESRIDGAEDAISDLEDGFQKLNEDFNIWGLFNKRMVPFIYEETFIKSLNYLEKTKYIETVECFKNLKTEKDFDIPYPLTKKNYIEKNNLRNKKIIGCTTFLKNSKEFLDAAKAVSIDTKPIFYYYFITFLFKFLMESLIDNFGHPKKHHGLFLNDKNDIKHIAFGYNQEGGFFERLVHTLSILNYPSSFSSFIPDLDEKKHIFLKEQKTDISISNKSSILLSKLLAHDFHTDYEKLELNSRPAGGHKRYEKTSIILREIILIFLSGSMARYNPILWRNIYSGVESDLIFHFEKSFNNVNDMIRLVDAIIIRAEKGTLYVRDDEW